MNRGVLGAIGFVAALALLVGLGMLRGWLDDRAQRREIEQWRRNPPGV